MGSWGPGPYRKREEAGRKRGGIWRNAGHHLRRSDSRYVRGARNSTQQMGEGRRAGSGERVSPCHLMVGAAAPSIPETVSTSSAHVASADNRKRRIEPELRNTFTAVGVDMVGGLEDGLCVG